MSLYYCRFIVSFVMDVETFVLTDVPEDITDVPVVMYVAYVLCAAMILVCMSKLGVCTVIVINIGVCTIVGSNTPFARCRHLVTDGHFGFCVCISSAFFCGTKVDVFL